MSVSMVVVVVVVVNEINFFLIFFSTNDNGESYVNLQDFFPFTGKRD